MSRRHGAGHQLVSLGLLFSFGSLSCRPTTPMTPARPDADTLARRDLVLEQLKDAPEGLTIREVVVTVEGRVPAFGSSEAAPVYVDVYDSGYGHGI